MNLDKYYRALGITGNEDIKIIKKVKLNNETIADLLIDQKRSLRSFFFKVGSISLRLS